MNGYRSAALFEQPLVQCFAQIRLVTVGAGVIHAPVDPAVGQPLEEVLAADGVRQQLLFDELQAVVLVFAGVVDVDALEEPALVAAAVRVEVLEGEPLAGRELIGEVADDAQLRLLGAGLHVVVARRLRARPRPAMRKKRRSSSTNCSL